MGEKPSVVLYEVGTEHGQLAPRSVDILAGGCTHNIPDLYDGAIEITPIPTVGEFSAHGWGEELHVCSIEKTEFEAVWESHIRNGALKQLGGIR